jgi:hypothetical protein
MSAAVVRPKGNRTVKAILSLARAASVVKAIIIRLELVFR